MGFTKTYPVPTWVRAGFGTKQYLTQASYGKREVRITVVCPSTSE